jgi:hypothetical protein
MSNDSGIQESCVVTMNDSKRKQRGLSRRRFFGAATGAAVVVFEVLAQTPPDLRLINGRIHTMDSINGKRICAYWM